MRSRTSGLLLSILVTSLLAQHGNKEQKPPQVFNSPKGWYLGDKQLEYRGYVPAIADVVSKESSELVLHCGESGLLEYTCVHVPCRVPVCATVVDGAKVRRLDPGARGGGPAPEFIKQAQSSLFRREPKAAVTLGVRAGGNPVDAVILQQGATLRSAPILRRIQEGRYCFELKHLPVAPADPGRKFTIDWDSSVDKDGVAQVPGVRPGLYALRKGEAPANGQCRLDEDGRTAWVLVADESSFARVNQEWTGYSSWFAELLKSGAAPGSVTGVQHAILASLADSIGDK